MMAFSIPDTPSPSRSRGGSRRIASITSTAEFPRNGRRRETISYSTHPNEKMSVRWSTGSPRTCSGDM